MRLLAHLFALIFFMSAVSYAGPLIVRNGAGQSEFSVIFAREHIAEFYENCALVCGLTADESNVLQDLIATSKKKIRLLFKDSSQMSSKVFLRTDEGIWINQDLLWLDQDQSKPFDVAEAASLWTDIFNVSGLPVESLKQNLISLLRSDLKATTLKIGFGSEVTALLWKQNSSLSDRLILHDSDGKTIDVTDEILKLLGTKAARFGQPHWARIQNSNVRRLHLEFVTTFVAPSRRQSRATVDLVVFAKSQAGSFSLDPSSIELTVFEE